MKLIDADAVADYISGFPTFKGGKIPPYTKEVIECVVHAIQMMPTAYDVDKVVEELAELAECSSQCASTFYEGIGCIGCMWTDVFSIVKRGDVDEF